MYVTYCYLLTIIPYRLKLTTHTFPHLTESIGSNLIVLCDDDDDNDERE